MHGGFLALGLSVFVLTAAAACAAPAPELATDTRPTSLSQAIIAGTPSANESVIQLASREVPGSSVYYRGCSGSLVAKNLVMTARHCASAFDPETAVITRTSEASLFYVFTGQDAPAHLADGTAPAAQGKQLVVPASRTILPDIAFIVLDREVTTASVASIRLSAPPVKGEQLTLIGFGRTETGDYAIERRERRGVSILGVGPFEGVFHGAGPDEFMIGEGACFGDSGGAAFSTTTGAIVGVTSRVQNGKKQTPDQPSAPCIGPDTEDIYTTVSAMKALVDRAFAAAGAKPLLEAPAADPADLPLPPERTGTETPAPPPATTTADDDAASGEASIGCSATSGAPRPAGAAQLGLALGAVLLARRRRRGPLSCL